MAEEFKIKTISLKECSRCGSLWSGESINLALHDNIVFAKVRIAYCPVCKEGYGEEMNRDYASRSAYQSHKRRIR